MRELAGKIAIAASPARSVSVSVSNLSSVDGGDVDAITGQMREELIRNGLAVVPADSAEVTITFVLSEGIDGYVWVADLRSLAGSKIVMATPKTLPKRDATVRLSLVLNESPVIASAEPILDFSTVAGAKGQPSLLVLRSDRIELLERKGESWASLISAPIHHSRPWPRDLRGRMDSFSSGQFQIFLPGVLCMGSAAPSLAVNCREPEQVVWTSVEPLGSISLAPDRNYFVTSGSSNVGSGSDSPAFYSLAVDATNGHSRMIQTGIGGVVRFVNEQGALTSLPVSWGDGMASLSSPCSSEWYVLGDSPDDWTRKDRLQIYKIVGSSTAPAGRPLDLSGPVLALWRSSDAKSVRVISRDLETGLYEASMVSVSCDN